MSTATSRKRKAHDIVVPDLSEDAAERKRVLNVLAQRRYRQRKREHLATLETKAKEAGRKAPESASGASSSGFGTSQDVDTSPQVSAGEQFPTPPELDELDHDITTALDDALLPLEDHVPNSLDCSIQTGLSLDSIPEFPFEASPAICDIGDEALGAGSLSPSSDFQFMPASPSSLTFQLLTNMPSEQPPISSELQCYQSETFTFPDDRLLDVPPLTLLRAMLTIATRLKLTDYIWNMAGISPFYTGPANISGDNTQPWLPLNMAEFPQNFHPTPTQRLIPHHPILDLLPWPTARDKLIQVFSLPVQLRPPSAADPMGLLGFVYDMEDAGEGIRVSGSDPFSPDMWEVGQLVFQRWWWAFEGSIVERSNRLRLERGQQGLVLGIVP